MFGQSVRMALDSILSNKMRSFLTMLGIIIGVIALVVLVSMVTSASSSITEEVNAMGTDTLNVTIMRSPSPLTRREVLALQDEPAFSYTACVNQTVAQVGPGDEMLTIMGVTPSYFEISGLELAAGRLIRTTDVENATYVAVFSAEAADTVFGSQDVVGKSVRIRGRTFQVVGVLEESDSLLASFMGSNVYIPYSTGARFMGGTENVSTLVAGAAPGTSINEAQTAMETYLNERLGDEDEYAIFSTSMISDALNNITGMLSLVLGGIAAISLLVGGIGIMNIMLVSVTERTREIGIRKAIGATTRDILVQFLIEALVLSLAGCLIGVLCSWGIIGLATWAAQAAGRNMVFRMSAGVVALAIIFASVIGVVFGIYPARKAATMKPIDALRYSN